MTWEPRNKSDGHDSDDDDSFRDTDDNSLSIGDNPCLNGATELSVKKESDSVTEKSNKSPVKPDSVQNHLDGVTNIGTIGQRYDFNNESINVFIATHNNISIE